MCSRHERDVYQTQELCDVYVSGEIKGSGNADFMKAEGGFPGRISLTGSSESGISAAVKKTAAGFAGEHEEEIIKTE